MNSSSVLGGCRRCRRCRRAFFEIKQCVDASKASWCALTADIFFSGSCPHPRSPCLLLTVVFPFLPSFLPSFLGFFVGVTRSPKSIRDSWMTCALLEDSRARSPSTREQDNNTTTSTFFSASLGGNIPGSRAWCINGNLQGESRCRKKKTTPGAAAGSQSPDTRKIRQRIHDAQAALRSLRSAAGARG